MARVDFWWDGAEPQPPAIFDRLLAQVVKSRPALRVPTIAIVCSTQRFRGSALHKAARRTGLLRTLAFHELPDDQIRAPDVALLHWAPFEGHTISDYLRSRIPPDVRVLNDTGLDTRKANVDAHFAAVAGYGTAIDIATGSGFAVLKSEINGNHDGRIVKLPLSSLAPFKVCQKLIDNSFGDYVVDLRIPFVLGNPVLAYVKFRERSRRFENANASVKLVTPADVLSEDEIGVCQRFCRSIGLQYGELDILRDRASGRIHVVDANNTPAGPPGGLSNTDRAAALRMIAFAFRHHVFELACGTMHSVPSRELSDREIELLQELRILQEALGVTLDYVQTELQPNPPANIARYRDHLEPAPDSHIDYAPVSEFLDVVTSMARFLSNSTAMETFRRRGVTGFADWVVLATIATQPPGLTDRQLTRFIGTSLKRTRRLADGLANAGMILLFPGAEAETFILEVTPAGHARLGEIEAELLPTLKSFLGQAPSQFIFCASLVRRFSRIHDRARRP